MTKRAFEIINFKIYENCVYHFNSNEMHNLVDIDSLYLSLISFRTLIDHTNSILINKKN